MNNKVALIAGALVLVLLGAGGGFVGAKYVGGGALRTRADGPGGAFAQLTNAERQRLQTMTEEERQAFFKEKGIDIPSGGVFTGGARGMRGRPGLLDGKVTALDAETVTVQLAAGGSQKIYLADDTVTAFEPGATPKLAVGSSVLAFAQPEAEGVNTAQLIVVKK